jgi:DNA-binding HxlR family transcriptional regulator
MTTRRLQSLAPALSRRPSSDKPTRPGRKRPSKTPLPGSPVRGSSTGRPIMALLDLLGRRGALRVLWELRGPAPLTFRALQDAAQTNPSVLNTRLQELRDAGIYAHDGEGNVLNPHGRTLFYRLAPLHAWAEGWARRRGG